MLNRQQIKQELWSYIEQLSEQKLRQLLSLVRLLLSKDTQNSELGNAVGLSQLEILQQLEQIRAEFERNHGVYHGNMLAEMRAEREEQLDSIHRWAN